MKTILFTGGGSAGHVTPNLALIHSFQTKGWQCLYMGSHSGIEKEIIGRIHIPYYPISTGKLRRYFSWQNFLTPWHVFKGMIEAWWLCRKLKPKVIFSKGGFVSFPVVFGGWLNRIPVVIHESDLTPGLANRLSYPFARKICLSFPDSQHYFKKKSKILMTGTPLREDILKGQREKGLRFLGFNENKPVLLIIGGGLGAGNINQLIRQLLPALLVDFQVAHLCGKGKADLAYENTTGYKQCEYVNEELADVYACAESVVSRAGANSIYELLALKKPHLLLPLSAKASRGDQILNANYFATLGVSRVLEDEKLNAESLLHAIQTLYQDRAALSQTLSTFKLEDSVTLISECIECALSNDI